LTALRTSASDANFIVDLPSDVAGFRAFGLLEDLQRELEAVVGRPVDVVTLGGPFSQEGAKMAERMQREAADL
jgi:hypothetical protein